MSHRRPLLVSRREPRVNRRESRAAAMMVHTAGAGSDLSR